MAKIDKTSSNNSKDIISLRAFLLIKLLIKSIKLGIIFISLSISSSNAIGKNPLFNFLYSSNFPFNELN